jgi:hypothetical protein
MVAGGEEAEACIWIGYLSTVGHHYSQQKTEADHGGRPQPGDRAEASGGNRTHNPRITNAVLCQLKLRWRSDTRGESAAAGLRRVAQSRWASQGAAFRNVPVARGGANTKKSGVSTRQERPAMVKRIRGKATARPKEVEDPTFSWCG